MKRKQCKRNEYSEEDRELFLNTYLDKGEPGCKDLCKVLNANGFSITWKEMQKVIRRTEAKAKLDDMLRRAAAIKEFVNNSETTRKLRASYEQATSAGRAPAEVKDGEEQQAM
jgi:hypothetical protein